ncbi:liprin-beta-1 isoform X2 [Hydra vulgaris]|uniref:liprin-beta-1 isoform X2 n=1 Tax=Hydra vulgaris TaxID=6087 RepID=UPI0032EA5EBD
MSAVGGDAAFMLERALEEMDSIFRENIVGITPSFKINNLPTSTPKSSKLTHNKNDENLIKIFDELELLLSNSINESGISTIINKRGILEHLKSLRCTFAFLNEMSSVLSSNNKDTNVVIHKLEQDNQMYLNELKRLHEQIVLTESQLTKTKKTLSDYARKNEELVIRLTERRIADQKEQTNQQLNYNKFLLIEDEKDTEMERLKNHIETLLDEQERRKSTGSTDSKDDNLTGLKSRLREKASECNRLKVQLDEIKQSNETKDNLIAQIQDQVQRLFKENEVLRQQLDNASTLQLLTPKSNGSVHSPESVCSESLSNRSFTCKRKNSKELFNKGSSSEPNLIHNGSRDGIGIIMTPAASLVNDETRYQPFKRTYSDSPFALWPCEHIQDWLRDEGLEEYASACSKSVKKGDDLLKFTLSDYERELGITDPMHKRKLSLALKAITSNEPDYAGRLDHHWVAKWLEDLGLPQYKQAFFMHKVDGRVLLNLTVDDVLQLKVYSLLHHASLKRAIQFLRHQKFHPQYLREIANQSEERCDHVMLWTNQRIMHWLRSVDLAEYAPNLRGSGVHGAFMVLEPRFNADTLADLLSIPYNKTLLRRHLGSHFMTLLGDACQRQKEMTQKTSDFVPLNGSVKHKLRKKGSVFGSLRRRKSETDLDALICSTELDVSSMYSPPPALDPDTIFDLSETNSFSPSFNDNGSSSTNETSTVPMIAELSNEIDQMTSNLGKENR